LLSTRPNGWQLRWTVHGPRALSTRILHLEQAALDQTLRSIKHGAHVLDQALCSIKR
jgi:hypothetical protein